MAETIINLDSVNPIEFFGVNNGKLDLLKKRFPLLKILSRGTQIKISGAEDQIESAKEKIADMYIDEKDDKIKGETIHFHTKEGKPFYIYTMYSEMSVNNIFI